MLPIQILGDIYSSKNKYYYSPKDKGRHTDITTISTDKDNDIFVHTYVCKFYVHQVRATGHHFDKI